MKVAFEMSMTKNDTHSDKHEKATPASKPAPRETQPSPSSKETASGATARPEKSKAQKMRDREMMSHHQKTSESLSVDDSREQMSQIDHDGTSGAV